MLVADKFLERPRMEQRFFGFRFDDLNAEGLSLDLKALNKVFTTLETIQGLELKTEWVVGHTLRHNASLRHTMTVSKYH